MKAVYKKYTSMKIHLKDHNVLWTKDNVGCFLYRPYHYGEVPNRQVVLIDVDNYRELVKYMPMYQEHGVTLFTKKPFVKFLLIEDKYVKLFEDEVSYIEIIHEYEIEKNPEISLLQKDLRFYKYSELVFDREQELKSMMLGEQK